MPKIENLKPGCFVNVGKNLFARRNDGKVFLVSPNNIIFDCSKKAKVNLISVSSVSPSSKANSSKSITIWSFWQIGNKIYPLNGNSYCQNYVELPENACFIGFYASSLSSKNDVEIFVKYFASNSYGIIRFKNNSIQHPISYESGYSNIEYEHGYFYGELATGRWKYKVLNSDGFILHEFLTNRRLLKGSELSYDSTKLYNDYTGVEIPGGIKSAYILEEDTFKFIVVKNASGIFYYSFKLDHILGPIKYDFVQPHETCCFVAEVDNRKYTKIFFLKHTRKNSYSCTSIENPKGIRYYSVGNMSFFDADNTLYVLHPENLTFEELFKEDFDKLTFNLNISQQWLDIICFKNDLPTCIIVYDTAINQIVSRNNVNVMGLSFDKSLIICQLQLLDPPILGITKEGKLIFSV